MYLFFCLVEPIYHGLSQWKSIVVARVPMFRSGVARNAHLECRKIAIVAPILRQIPGREKEFDQPKHVSVYAH